MTIHPTLAALSLVLITVNEGNDLVGGKKRVSERMIRPYMSFITNLLRSFFYVSADPFNSMFGIIPENKERLKNPETQGLFR